MIVPRLKLFFLLVPALFLFGFGCKTLTAEELASIKPVTLNYWTVFDDVAQLKKFAAEYKQTRPYVKINIRQVRYEEFDKLFTNALADNVGPDIVSVHSRWLGRYTQRLSPMPASVVTSRIGIKSKLNKEMTITPETFNLPSRQYVEANLVQSVGEGIESGGQIYGLPLAVDTLAIYYNKELLDRSGIPEPPTSWDEFVAAVKKITKFNSNGDIVQSGVALGTGANIDNSFDVISLLMMQNGVNMGQGGSVAFSSGLGKADYTHPALQALRFYTDFANSSKEVYSWNKKMGDAFTAFVQGKTAFYFGYAFDNARILARAPGMKLKVIPMLQLNKANPTNVSNFWIQSVVKDAKNQNEAWDFIRYVSTAENVKIYTDKTGQPSPYRAHIKEQSENVVLAPFVSQVLFAKNWYNGRNIDAAEQAFTTMVEGFLEPYKEKEKPLDRDRELIINAARVVQQTM